MAHSSKLNANLFIYTPMHVVHLPLLVRNPMSRLPFVDHLVLYEGTLVYRVRANE